MCVLVKYQLMTFCLYFSENKDMSRLSFSLETSIFWENIKVNLKLSLLWLIRKVKALESQS